MLLAHMCAASYEVWCRDLGTRQANLRPNRQKWNVCSTPHTRTVGPTSGSGRGKSIIHNQQCGENETSGPDQGTSQTTDGPRVSPFGDHTTHKYDKGDQPSRGETTWTNTRGTRSGKRTAKDRLTWMRHAENTGHYGCSIMMRVMPMYGEGDMFHN